MARYDFQVVGEYNVLRSIEYDAQDTVNLYIVNDPTAKKPNSLQPMAGLQQRFSLPGSEPIRDNGLFKLRDFMYGVCGEKAYKFNASGAPIFLGDVNSFDTAISWANSPSEIGFVDQVSLYSYNINTGVFQVITDIDSSDFPSTPQMIYYQDGRFILSFADSPNYYYSGFADSTSGALEKWDPDNTFVQQSRPDLSVGISGANERLFLFGRESVETWAPYTTPNLLPFYRDNNFIYEFGCAASRSIVKGVLDTKQGGPVSSFVAWLATNNAGAGCFVLATGGNAIKISSEAIDLRLSKLSRLDDCVSTVYKEGAHIFIENTFEQENVTFVVDLTTMAWFRKERLDDSRSLINSHVYFEGAHYVGSRVDSTIYQLSDEYLDEDGTAIRRSRSTFTFTDTTYKRIVGNFLEIDFEAGNVGVSDDPVAFLSISYDGGRTYGNPRPAPMGKIGQYRWKAQWLGLGVSYNFTFKIETYDAVRVFILGGAFDYEVLTE